MHQQLFAILFFQFPFSLLSLRACNQEAIQPAGCQCENTGIGNYASFWHEVCFLLKALGLEPGNDGGHHLKKGLLVCGNSHSFNRIPVL